MNTIIQKNNNYCNKNKSSNDIVVFIEITAGCVLKRSTIDGTDRLRGVLTNECALRFPSNINLLALPQLTQKIPNLSFIIFV